MLFILNVINALLIIVPALLGWIHFRHIRPDFYPFIIILSAGFCCELISLLLICRNGNNTAWYNLYALLYAILLLWQFNRWQQHNLLLFLGAIVVLVWCIAFTQHRSLKMYYSGFMIIRDAAIVLISLLWVNQRLHLVTHKIYRDPIFLICLGWILLFADDLITELLLLYGQQLQTPYLSYLEPLFSVIDLIVIIIHSYAVLCMPPKIP